MSALAAQMGLRRAPARSGKPCCRRALRHRLFPSDDPAAGGLNATLSPEDLRLALAHEMAHVKRGDLRLALLPAAMQVLFFFHPLVWLASAEWAAAREEACDALALQATGAVRLASAACC